MTTSSLSITFLGNEDTEFTVALAEPERDPNTFITSRGAAVQPVKSTLNSSRAPQLLNLI